MRSRYPLLWLKKRGKRRSGSPRWAHSGELLYHSVFVAVGVVACWWHAATVIAPDWRQREQAAQLDQQLCQIESTRVERRDVGFAPLLRVRLLDESGAPVGEPLEVLAAEPAHHLAPAEQALGNFPTGATTPCLIDPASGQPLGLAPGARWWIWWVLLIPLSLVVLGLVGMVRTVLRAGVSAERRLAVAQQAGYLDPIVRGAASMTSASGLPSTHYVDDSPGVKLRYRLPIEGAMGWRLVGMTIMCVGWNLLVGFFLIGVVSDHLAGRPNWPVTLVVTPLACAGGWLAYSLLRDARAATGVGVTQVEISTHPLIPGQTGGGVVLQAGQFRARWLTIALVCDEIATYCEGTDTRTSTHEVYREVLHRERRFRVEVDRPYEQAFTFTPPVDAMHSFVSAHNEVRWSIEVRGAPMRWPVFQRRFQLCVYPTNWRPDDPADKYPDFAEATV